jgi:hypothetical protein
VCSSDLELKNHRLIKVEADHGGLSRQHGLAGRCDADQRLAAVDPQARRTAGGVAGQACRVGVTVSGQRDGDRAIGAGFGRERGGVKTPARQGGQIGQVNYAAAKSGIHGFTKSLAMEGARFGVTANAIAPGYIATEMLSTIPDNVMEKIVAQIPVGRLGQPEEIARGVEFLTSDNASFITGSTLSINGGQHMY